MRKLISAAMTLVMLNVSLTPAWGQELVQKEQKKREKIQKELVKLHKILEASPDQYEKTLKEQAAIARKLGDKATASQLEALSNPKLQPHVMGILKEKMKEQQKNGLIFLILAVAFSSDTDDGYDHQQFDQGKTPEQTGRRWGRVSPATLGEPVAPPQIA